MAEQERALRHEAAGLGNVVQSQPIDAPRNTPDLIKIQARRAVDGLLQYGVIFSRTRRIDGSAGFTWVLPHGGDRSKVRRVLADAKCGSIGYWIEFERIVLAAAGGPL